MPSLPSKRILLTVGLSLTVVVGLLVPAFLGFQLSGRFGSFIVVIGDSMVPTISPTDLVYVSEVHVSELKVGDVLVFRNIEFAPETSGVIIHRVIGVVAGEMVAFKTKGDNTSEEDPFLVESRSVIGRVDYVIPRLGAFFIAPFNIFLLFGILLLVWSIYLYANESGVQKKDNYFKT